MDKPNKELLQAFIDWFMREYSNFGGKPIAERYEEAFDTFNNDFIDARYDAFQDGWKVQQAKVEELQNQVTDLDNRATQYALDEMATAKLNGELQKRVDAALQEIFKCRVAGLDRIYALDVIEQALKGEGND